MKGLIRTLAVAAVLSMVVSCGKSNEGGSSSQPSGATSGASREGQDSGVQSNSAALGKWQFAQLSILGISINYIMTVSENTVTFENTCKGTDGQSVTAKVTLQAEIGNDSIKFLEAKKVSEPITGGSCSAGMDAGEMSYSISGNTMTLQANGQSMSIPRIN